MSRAGGDLSEVAKNNSILFSAEALHVTAIQQPAEKIPADRDVFEFHVRRDRNIIPAPAADFSGVITKTANMAVARGQLAKHWTNVDSLRIKLR